MNRPATLSPTDPSSSPNPPEPRRGGLSPRLVLGASAGALALGALLLMLGAARGAGTSSTSTAKGPSTGSGSQTAAARSGSRLDPSAALATSSALPMVSAHSGAARAIPEHSATRPLPLELAGRVAELEGRVRADASDAESRAALAVALLEGERYIEAFRLAEELETLRPGDPRGRYVRSVVRLRMGQNQAAIEGLEGVLEEEPDHVDALRVLGLAQLRVGDAGAAIATWERGLTAAGGRHAELERLLAVSRSARAEKGVAR